MKQRLLLLLFCFSYFFAMEKLHLDTIALIICQPNNYILSNMNIEGRNVASKSEKINFKQKIKNFCDIFMPAFRLLLTCKGYYNNKFKEKVKSFLTTCYIPQGTCLYFLPKSMHQEILQNNTYLETEKLFETLKNLCVQEQPITHDLIEEIVNLDIVSKKLNCIVYKGWMPGAKRFFKPYTFIEYLFSESTGKYLLLLLNSDMSYKSHTIKNIFFLIEYLLSKKVIDLELPTADNSQSIQQYLFQLYEYEKDKFSYYASLGVPNLFQLHEDEKDKFSYYASLKLPIISNLAPDVPPKEKPCEEKALIGSLADLFLFSKYKIYLNRKQAIVSRLTELSHIKTQKNIHKSIKKITFFLIFIMSIISYCYNNGYFKKIM